MSNTTDKDHSQGQLALAKGLTQKTKALCLGLETGAAEILDLVTPTTADLLKWWFGEDMVTARVGLNFHEGQKQAILNTIVAHEVLGADHEHWTLRDLYQATAPDALLTGKRLEEVSSPKHAHPKYCMKMATGTGKTWVLQALMIWQLLNKTHALAEGVDDPRFTRQFMIVAPGLIVYERLLDAFCGKLVPGGNGARDFAKSDVAQFADLFIPEAYRDVVFGFVRGNVCSKAEIGLKATGNGMIAITNWHLLAEGDDVAEDVEEITAPGAEVDPKEVVSQVLPLTPGRATGNSLEVLDRRYARGNVLEFLTQLPELMVFNDEAHHIHDFKREGETTEVEWQKSLSRIAGPKGRRFVQVDFSATPYNDVGTGKNKKKVYFPHIVVDFDLKSAMKAGLVKSLVLDKRKEIGALPLEFKAERDDNGNPTLSEGQRVMLRAGLAKLRKLERDFAGVDPSRHPKMLVVCEDTTVSPLVAEFLCDQEGLHEDEVMTIDSGKKAELGEKDWAPVRERLFNVDRHATPKVIVSVLMLREGFDVNNICVIVPLRSSQAQILLEQTIGRGLRLMWRDAEYNDIKRENRERINAGQEPGSLLDVLSIVEHPAFQSFYDELIQEGLVGSTGDDDNNDGSAAGDVIAAELHEDYEQFDFGIPFILQEADELRDHATLDIDALPTFTAMGVEQLKGMLGKGDTFVSQDLQSATLFGDYRVDGAVMNVGGYNDYLSRLTRRISQALSEPLPKGNKVATHLAKPYMQVNTAELTGWLDDYIWTQLFGDAFNPLEDENWRLLLLSPVVDHITKVFAVGLLEAEEKHTTGETEVHLRYLSEVKKLMVRESASVEVSKCIYTRLGWPSRNGGLEKAFIHWAQADSQVQAFCKINENRHTYVRLRYVKDDGLPAFYSPDFLVRTEGAVYLVETKAQDQTNHPNVQRKRKAALAWCDRINQLTDDQRQSPPWHYVLLGESIVYEWQGKGARLSELLDYARLRPLAEASLQQRLI
jgi:type III restriction enzyme